MHVPSHKADRNFQKTTVHNYRRKKTNYSEPTKNTFERDLLAMKQVWEMLKEGTVRWCGEVGRQY